MPSLSGFGILPRTTSSTGTTLSHESIRSFLRDCHTTAARIGCLDMNLLSVAGKFIAFAYNYRYGGDIYGLRIGYDPDASKLSPGNMMYDRSFLLKQSSNT